LSRSQRGQLHFDIVIYPIENVLETGLETGIVLLIDDVTKQVQSMNMLIQKDKLSSMGELASSMAQDINLPLQHIIKSIEYAYQVVSEQVGSVSASETMRQYSEGLQVPLLQARNESYRAAAITSNLVDFAASHRHSKRPQDIIDVLEHALSLAAGIYADTKGLKFNEIIVKRHYEENLPHVLCNAGELQQVFLSLLRHCSYALADKFFMLSQVGQRAVVDGDTQQEDVCSEVQRDEAANKPMEMNHSDWRPQITLTVLESYEVLWLKIQHNGVGLSPVEQQMIFEPYFNNTQIAGGVDCGESLEADRRQSFSYFIITDHHKGQMAVTSDVDVGTTFHMELRLK
ncbi:MAG: hypothetical protein P8176_06850, partial [Gammaproteobacteria bacterium]